MQPQPYRVVSGYQSSVGRPVVSSGQPVQYASSPQVVTSQPRVVAAPTASGASVPLSSSNVVYSSQAATRVIPAAGPRVISQAAPVTSSGARIIQGGPATVIRQGATVMSSPTIIRSNAGMPVMPTTRQNVTSGPGLTQGAYEVKHAQDDPQLANLKELRKTSGLKDIPVSEGLQAMKQAGAENDGKLTRDVFLVAYEGILTRHAVELPADSVRNAVFDLFDRDDNGVVDMMELICGISLLCAGSEDDKINAVFDVFDENGDGFISMDEMYKFLTSVFKVVLTPNVMGVMNSMGVTVESPDDLASVTALECFKTADLNQDGKLSVSEFKSWFYAPRNDPSFLFSPVRKLLS